MASFFTCVLSIIKAREWDVVMFLLTQESLSVCQEDHNKEPSENRTGLCLFSHLCQELGHQNAEVALSCTDDGRHVVKTSFSKLIVCFLPLSHCAPLSSSYLF